MDERLLLLLLLGIPVELAVSVACARIADVRGRRPMLWAVIGFVFGILGVVAVLLLPSVTAPPREDLPAS